MKTNVTIIEILPTSAAITGHSLVILSCGHQSLKKDAYVGKNETCFVCLEKSSKEGPKSGELFPEKKG